MSSSARLAATVLALVLAGATAAEQPGAKSSDEALYVAMRDVINRGADLYNGGDPAACYRLFEGSLLTIKPTLDRYPELQKAIVRGLSSAEKDPVMWRRAFTLRDVLDKVRAEVNPNKGKEKSREPKKAKEPEGELEKLPFPKKDEEKDA